MNENGHQFYWWLMIETERKKFMNKKVIYFLIDERYLDNPLPTPLQSSIIDTLKGWKEEHFSENVTFKFLRCLKNSVFFIENEIISPFQYINDFDYKTKNTSVMDLFSYILDDFDFVRFQNRKQDISFMSLLFTKTENDSNEWMMQLILDETIHKEHSLRKIGCFVNHVQMKETQIGHRKLLDIYQKIVDIAFLPLELKQILNDFIANETNSSFTNVFDRNSHLDENKLFKMTYPEKIEYVKTFLNQHVNEFHDEKMDWTELILNLVPSFSVNIKRLKSNYEDLPKLSIQGQRNIYFASLLFYLFTNGKYVDEVWKSSLSYFSLLKEKVKELTKTSDELCLDQGGMTIFFQEQFTNIKRQDIYQVISNTYCTGEQKMFEMLWEILVTKYPHYDIEKNWYKWFLSLSLEEEEARCYGEISIPDLESFYMSIKGKMRKIGHETCQDASLVEVIEDGIWFAVCCDGVGSCTHSADGSFLAIEAFKQVLLSNIRKDSHFGCQIPLVDLRKIYANIYDYFQNNFGKDLLNQWKTLVYQSEPYKNDSNSTLLQFATTFQFVFCYQSFIICGALGDGHFYIRKKETFGNNTYDGGFVLNDGISGVTQTSVFTLLQLEESSSVIHYNFFNIDEVSSILISSDGVMFDQNFFTLMEVNKGTNHKTMSILQGMKQLEKMPLEEKVNKLKNLVLTCSDFNETGYGTGDDCSLVYLHLIKK